MLLGIAGPVRSGKNTVTHFLQEHIPGLLLYNFRTPICRMLDAELGTNTVESEEEKDLHRTAMRNLGARYRALDPLYWVKKVEEDISTLPRPLIVSGIRLFPEVEMIHRLGGSTILVDINKEIHQDRFSSDPEHYNHPSEFSLHDYTGWTYRIQNDGTLDDLKWNVATLAEALIADHKSMSS
jgi:uridine kinase